MIQNSEVSDNTDIAVVNVRLQTEVNGLTKDYLRVEAIRRKVTMGQLLDEIVELFSSTAGLESVSKTNS